MPKKDKLPRTSSLSRRIRSRPQLTDSSIQLERLSVQSASSNINSPTRVRRIDISGIKINPISIEASTSLPNLPRTCRSATIQFPSLATTPTVYQTPSDAPLRSKSSQIMLPTKSGVNSSADGLTKSTKKDVDTGERSSSLNADNPIKKSTSKESISRELVPVPCCSSTSHTKQSLSGSQKRHRSKSLQVTKPLAELLKPLQLTGEQLDEIKRLMIDEINDSLTNYPSLKGGMKLLLSHICQLPSGSEEGEFLAVDVQSRVLRLAVINIEAGVVHVRAEHESNIAQELSRGTIRALFFYVADCIAEFLTTNQLTSQTYHIVVSMWHPLEVKNVSSARVLSATKDHSHCNEYQKEDVAGILLAALGSESAIDFDLVTICNSASAILIYAAHLNKFCRIGLVAGNICNAAYFENASRINKCPQGSSDGMIIDTEWRDFGDQGSIDKFRSEFDQMVDKGSSVPGKHIFEKMTSAHYLGELVRFVLVKCCRNKMILGGNLPATLQEKDCIKFTNLVSIQADSGETTPLVQTFLKTLGVKNVTPNDIAGVQLVVSCILTRSAHLVATGLAALVSLVNKPKVVIGIDGLLFKHIPSYRSHMETQLRTLVGSKIDIDFVMCHGAQGKGASIAGAMALKAGVKPRVGKAISPVVESNNLKATDAKKMLEIRNAPEHD